MASVAWPIGRRTAAVTLTVLLGACSGSSPSNEPTTPRSSSAATPTTDAVDGPTPMPTSETPLEPGTYTFPAFAPPVAFSVGEGWTAGHELADFFDVQHPDAVVVFSAPAYVYDRQGVRRDAAGMAPRVAASTLAANADLGAGPVQAATVGGEAAATVQLIPTAAVGLFGGEFPYTTAVGTAYRVTFVAVNGTLLVVMAVSRERPFGPGFADAQGVTRSVSFD
jgi:hypothetical protein